MELYRIIKSFFLSHFVVDAKKNILRLFNSQGYLNIDCYCAAGTYFSLLWDLKSFGTYRGEHRGLGEGVWGNGNSSSLEKGVNAIFSLISAWIWSKQGIHTLSSLRRFREFFLSHSRDGCGEKGGWVTGSSSLPASSRPTWEGEEGGVYSIRRGYSELHVKWNLSIRTTSIHYQHRKLLLDILSCGYFIP